MVVPTNQHEHLLGNLGPICLRFWLFLDYDFTKTIYLIEAKSPNKQGLCNLAKMVAIHDALFGLAFGG